MIQRLRGEAFRHRLAELRPQIATFRGGRLEIAAKDTLCGMLYVRRGARSPSYIGGAHAPEVGAIAELVNFVLDLAAPEVPGDRAGDGIAARAR